jgi:hypothetical protein
LRRAPTQMESWPPEEAFSPPLCTNAAAGGALERK